MTYRWIGAAGPHLWPVVAEPWAVQWVSPIAVGNTMTITQKYENPHNVNPQAIDVIYKLGWLPQKVI